MGEIIYTAEQHHPLQRIGGYYENIADLEAAVDLMEIDVLVGPKTKKGYFMVPATPDQKREITYG